MSIAEHIPDSINDWFDLPAILRARLDNRQRASLAFMALKALDRDDALQTAEAALAGAGQPVVPLFNCMDAAAHWADMAMPEEIEAYCFASFNRMASRRQTAFLEYVQGRAAA
jgi:hypothetical protein